MSDLPAYFSGPVNNYSKKLWLQQLAQSLSLSSEGTIKQIVPRINAHFAANKELYNDPKYQGIVAYRKQHSEATKIKTAKTSADKDAEDAEEAEKFAEVKGQVTQVSDNSFAGTLS